MAEDRQVTLEDNCGMLNAMIIITVIGIVLLIAAVLVAKKVNDELDKG